MSGPQCGQLGTCSQHSMTPAPVQSRHSTVAVLCCTTCNSARFTQLRHLSASVIFEDPLANILPGAAIGEIPSEIPQAPAAVDKATRMSAMMATFDLFGNDKGKVLNLRAPSTLSHPRTVWHGANHGGVLGSLFSYSELELKRLVGFDTQLTWTSRGSGARTPPSSPSPGPAWCVCFTPCLHGLANCCGLCGIER